MSRSKHTEAPIIAALKQVEAGRTMEDVGRECGVSKHTIYAWKAKYGGCRSPKSDRQNDIDFQQPGRNNHPTCSHSYSAGFG